MAKHFYREGDQTSWCEETSRRRKAGMSTHEYMEKHRNKHDSGTSGKRARLTTLFRMSEKK